jgi:integrase
MFNKRISTVKHIKISVMERTKTKKEHSFFILFDKFIADSNRGRRLQPNGKRLSQATVKNYTCTKKLVEKFCQEKEFRLRIREEKRLNSREMESERNYWKKFYKKFTDFLYNDLGCFDNYIGQNIKNLKTFFNYLNRDTSINFGNFHKQFYVRKEDVKIFPLLPEELNFLIYNQELNEKLSPRLRETKDVFVFGCTVALRVSDLLKLRRSALRISSGQYYLSVRSQKTSTDTLIKLPDYCVEIILKYHKLRRRLLPCFNKSNLNQYIKKLLEQAGFVQEVSISRDRRGQAVELKNVASKSRQYRFCDVASTHTMRRTAITTMLCLGMPEQLVRKISGHAAGTKEFYRYVLWAQTYQDQESDKMFEKLMYKKLSIV